VRIIDGQLHEPTIHLDWSDVSPELRRRVLTETALAHLTTCGIDAALLFATDLEWGREASAEHPDKFALVIRGNVLAEDPDIEDQIAAAAADPTVVAWRLVISYRGKDPDAEVQRLKSGVYDKTFDALEKNGLPLFLFASRNLDLAAGVAQRHPGLNIVIDHLGIPQPPLDPRDSPPFHDLPEVTALARFPNVGVKVCGAVALSEQPWPHADVWPHMRTLVDAFGADRLVWASDISRFYGKIGFHGRMGFAADYDGAHSLFDSLRFVLDTETLSDDEKAGILGGGVRNLVGWGPE
jgi:predicted TIM-barrel fold metal-dependent hydrolase